MRPWAVKLYSFLYPHDWPARLVRQLGCRAELKVREHTVAVRSIGGPAPLRVAYASDFHAGPMTDGQIIAGACDALRAAAPDVLLLGGDFVEHDAAQIEWVAPLLGAVPAPAGRFAVLGNHDWWTDAPRITDALERAGVQVLVNRNVRLAEPYENVWICGLGDPWGSRPDPAASFEGASGMRLLLMHSPSGLLDVGRFSFDLALCGHTHGGQIALPGGIPIIVPHGPLSRRYARGRFEVGGGRAMIVSCGVGCSALPLRVFADPEILVCTISEAAVAEA